MPNPDFYIRTGDTASIISATLKDDAGDPVNIANADVRFHMAPISGNATPTLDAAAANDQVTDGSDGTRGMVSYAWAAGNTALGGLYLCEWEVTFSGGLVQTFPNFGYVLLKISEQVV